MRTTRLPRAVASLLALAFLVALALPAEAVAATFRSPYFTLELPKDWSLVEGPFKKNGGEAAVIGRRDHKASVQIMSGPIKPGEFETIVKGYAHSLRIAEPTVKGQQAMFEASRNGQRLTFIFRCNDSRTKLVIFICNGDMKGMKFLSGMQTKEPGLVPTI